MSTPGNLLTGIGIAGKEALKTWQAIKKGDKDAATAKHELALKYAELADTKAKDAEDAKEKMYTKWTTNKDGTISTSQVTGKKTGKERAAQIVNDMDSVYSKGKLGNLSEKQAVRFANDYVTAYTQTSTTSSVTGLVTNLSGKVSPDKMFKVIREKYPTNEALSRSAQSYMNSLPMGKKKLDYNSKQIATKGLLDNVLDYRKDLSTMGPNTANWYGSVYRKIEGAAQPFYNQVSLADKTTQESMKNTAQSTFKKVTGIDANDPDISVDNAKMFTMAYGLARQIMKVGYDESGKALSDKDMDAAMNMIAAGFGTTATPKTMMASVNAAMKSMSNSQFRKYESLFNDGSQTSEQMKTSYLSTFDKTHANYLSGLHGKGWQDALPASYQEANNDNGQGQQTGRIILGTDGGYTLNGNTVYKNDTGLLNGLIQKKQSLNAKFAGDLTKASTAFKEYIRTTFDKELIPSILQQLQGN